MNESVLNEKNYKFQNRSRLEIMAQLLDHARPGAPKMHLIYGARLSHRLGSSYIEHLVKVKLLDEFHEEKGNKIYKTSERGFKFLEMYEQISEITFGSSIPQRAEEEALPKVPVSAAQLALVQVSS